MTLSSTSGAPDLVLILAALLLALGVYAYRRFRPMTRGARWIAQAVLVLTGIYVVGSLVVLMHDYVLAGQNYERQSVISCSNVEPPRTTISRAFVIAKYKENTTWMTCPEFAGVEMFLYEKRNPANVHHAVSNDSRHHIYVENVGYECATYAQYIVDHYYSLPDRVFFVQGNPFEHCPGFAVAASSALSRDFYFLSDFNTWFRPSGWPHFWPHQGFGAVFERMYRQLFDGASPPSNLRTYFNGQFMASRKAIQRRPPEFYAKVLELVTTRRDAGQYSWGRKGDGWLECGVMERLWQKVFTDQDVYDPYPREEAFCELLPATDR